MHLVATLALEATQEPNEALQEYQFYLNENPDGRDAASAEGDCPVESLLLGQRPLPFFIDSALLSVCCAVATDLDHTFSGLSRAHLARLGSYFGQSCDRLRLHRTKAVSFVRPTRCTTPVCYG